MTDWSVETDPARGDWLGRTWNIAENFNWLDPEVGREYLAKLKEAVALLSEGFCPDHRERLSPGVSRHGGQVPGGVCPVDDVLHILDQYGHWMEPPAKWERIR